MSTQTLKITYDWAGAGKAERARCRQRGEHSLPEDGREGQEKPGTYVCARCGVVKVVKEPLR